MSRINSESVDFTGLTVKCDSWEVDGVVMDTTDMTNVAAFVGDLTASAAELNLNDGAIAGTAVASKTLALGASKDVDTLDIVAPKFNGVAINATAAEINQYCDESAKTEVVSSTNVLAASESGKTMFLSSATEFDTTLPAAALGLNFRFIVTAAPVGANYTITAATADTIIGKVFSAAGDAGDVENTAGGDLINFVDGQSVAGDRVDLWCDGTYWYATCWASVAAGITITG